MRKTTSYVLSMALSVSLLAPYTTTTVKANTYAEPQLETPISIRLAYSAFQKSSYTFSIFGNYSVKGKNDLMLTNGTYTIKNNNNKIELIYNGSVLYSGSEITLFPVDYNRSQFIKLGSYNFLGNITFKPNGSYVLPVNTLEHEDYLLGVVAAEMSDSWGDNGGIEALKAQAITARTYSNGDVGKEIDNGQSYQVYNGFNNNYQNVINAVDSTRKQVITYNGTSIDKNAVFSSSNGGTMISKINSWGSASWNNIPYLVRNTDPYDARSGSSNINWQFSLQKNQIDLSGLDLTKPEIWWNSVQEESSDSSKISSLKNFIKRYQTQFKNHDLKILSINELDFTEHNDNPTSNTPLNGHIKISFVAFDPATNTYVKNQDGTIQVQTFDKTTRTYDYYLYNAFGSNTIKSPNIKSVIQSSTQYVVNGGGWGHGIGLSQWGAYQRSKEGQKASQIISFYYPGTTLTQYVQKPDKSVPTTPESNKVFATANSPINLRSSGSWSGSVLKVIDTGQTMEVIDTSSDWYKVSFESQIGYVHKNYITIKEVIPEVAEPTPTPLPEPIQTPKIKILESMNTQEIFYGKYNIEQKSKVSVRLNGPNGYEKLTFLDTLESGSYAFGGPISQAPPGNYTITITVEAYGQTVTNTINFFKKSGPSISVSDINTTSSAFLGDFTVNQDSKVAIYLIGPNVNKFIYYQDVKAGKHIFGGPLSSSLPNGLYTVRIEADNGSETTTTSKNFNINRGTPTSINVKTFSLTSGVYYGTYSIDKNSLVAVSLKGPNGLHKLTYYQQTKPGTYAFAGNINSFPKGDYTIVVTAKNEYGINSSTSKHFNFGNLVATKTYTVSPGDTLWSISRKFNVPVSSIMSWNHINSTSLKVGQVLKVTQ